MKFYLPILLLSFLIASSGHNLYAQKSKHVGFNTTLETSSSNFKPGFGFTFEQRMTKRSGFETGLYYRNYIQNLYLTFSDGASVFQAENVLISESYLSIPALYKFHTRLVNISAGPSFEFYVGWNQKNRDPIFKLDNYSMDPAFNIGLLTKISKSIKLNEQFVLEPELRLNPILTNDRAFIGLGIAAKYKL